jgi:hypothetical protein
MILKAATRIRPPVNEGSLQAVKGLPAKDVARLHHDACDAAHDPYLNFDLSKSQRRNSDMYGLAQL